MKKQTQRFVGRPPVPALLDSEAPFIKKNLDPKDMAPKGPPVAVEVKRQEKADIKEGKRQEVWIGSLRPRAPRFPKRPF